MRNMKHLFAACALWVVLAVASPALAAFGTPTLVGFSAKVGTATTSIYTLGVGEAIPAGTLLVDFITLQRSDASTINTTSDSVNGTTGWTCGTQQNAPSGTGHIRMCWTFLPSGLPDGATITSNSSSNSSSPLYGYLFKVTGVLALDATGTNNSGNSSTVSYTAPAQANARELAFMFNFTSVNVTQTPPAGWTNLNTGQPSQIQPAYTITSGGSPGTVSFDLSSSWIWRVVGATFTETSPPLSQGGMLTLGVGQ